MFPSDFYYPSTRHILASESPFKSTQDGFGGGRFDCQKRCGAGGKFTLSTMPLFAVFTSQAQVFTSTARSCLLRFTRVSASLKSTCDLTIELWDKQQKKGLNSSTHSSRNQRRRKTLRPPAVLLSLSRPGSSDLSSLRPKKKKASYLFEFIYLLNITSHETPQMQLRRFFGFIRLFKIRWKRSRQKSGFECVALLKNKKPSDINVK